ncbi:MAG TPA: methylenetetrahydrofolate reductase [Candidatus Marinimicrobia bacterium]|nr:methylenetetrahydrofolate reductase [Candidatus Neomarinimicrobiota bacterium]HOV23498.1 methylenetetrahydrofolate reductase [Candidatus Neomarinimicrobiota bacterium]HPI27021.1 methylenetetrahydrofolate reductase [Candidatus Neomarinimicrobiota bacterium]HRD18253.1 methylenetetrahydrofolate reductase [Candidatus Neomarinimicrobiota bacterium]HRS91236.1 methylenetetrahydrofolate reductase [Candidatus Neomarinimicrobiota bacterium]
MTLREKINSGKFIVCGEIGPPQSCDGDVIRRKAQYFKGIADAVNITDNQTAIPRLSSIASAKILLDEGVEPIIQMTCRDRNRLAIQSDLLGAAALGIRNVLCLTGDYQKLGDNPEAKGVFDLDSIQLIATVAQMNSGYLLSGREMKKAPEFLIGGAANPFAVPFEMRLIRLYKKVKAGVNFIQTQPVFDPELFIRWMEKVVEMGLHEKVAILAGVMPVKSVNTLLHMREDVPGVKINDVYIRRMEKAADPQAEGIKIAVEIIQTVKNIKGIRGVHIMPFMWESIMPTVVKEAGLCN